MFKKTGSSKYGDILTMLLVVLIVVILCIVAYFGYDMYSRNTKTNNAQTAMAEFEQATKSVRKKKVTNTVGESEETSETTEVIERENVPDDQTATGQEVEATEQTQTDKPEREKVMYEGYEMLGTIKIPATKCEYPILAEVTKHSIEVAVAKLYGPDLNTPGNVVIVGHNYRNGMFFSNNSKLKNGDSIYITSPEETVVYEIYNMYYTTPDDAEYMRRNTKGRREISLSTCNNDSSQRLIIWAKEKI